MPSRVKQPKRGKEPSNIALLQYIGGGASSGNIWRRYHATTLKCVYK